jgi:hypothetical protein
MDPDPDPGGPKTRGSGGSTGSNSDLGEPLWRKKILGTVPTVELAELDAVSELQIYILSII